jgi:putative zinc finger/helix-turn-helix YgiT family protein
MKQQGQISSREVASCGFCGESRVSTRLEDDRFQYGDGNDAAQIVAVIPVHHCGSCGAEFTDDAAEDIRHDAVCRHLGVLTPSEIRHIRESRQLSRAEFARLTRIGEATLARWERGSLIQNAGYDQLLRLLRHDENVARLRLTSSLLRDSAPVHIVQFRYLTVDDTRRKEQADFRLRKTA